MGNQCFVHKTHNSSEIPKNFSVKIKLKKHMSSKKKNITQENQNIGALNCYSKKEIHFNQNQIIISIKTLKKLNDLEEIMELVTLEQKEI